VQVIVDCGQNMSMSIRIGFLGVSHVHAPGYVHELISHGKTTEVGFFEPDDSVATEFAAKFGLTRFETAEELVVQCEAVIIAGISSDHVGHLELAAKHNVGALCEKPVAINESEIARIKKAILGKKGVYMTAFPCPYSPAFNRLVNRIEAGEIGQIVSICATNRGTNPGGWFTEKEKSGGGAMIDHTVHVADLLARLLKKEPKAVTAITGNEIFSQGYEDTAILTLDYDGGEFATIDSSCSRPPGYRTWGDVMLNVVGTKGVIEIDLFAQEIDVYRNEGKSHKMSGYGSSLNKLMIDEFVEAIVGDRKPLTTLEDGLAACEIALKGYASLKAPGPVPV